MRTRLFFLLLLFTLPALADDVDAILGLRASTKPVEPARAWNMFAEGVLRGSDLTTGGNKVRSERLSLDLQYEKSILPAWRAFFSDRLDIVWPTQATDRKTVNTLREAFISWQPSTTNTVEVLDVGRINARYGVARGYNPTDFFRTDALRSIVSVDPVSLKNNRLGSAMVRGQTLWSHGSLTALYSPKLERESEDTPFNPDFGATNNRNRWLLAMSQRLSEKVDLNPQWMIFGDQGKSPQLGINLTTLINDATVAYVEWSGGRSRSDLAEAIGQEQPKSFRNHVSSGVTISTPDKSSVTLEYQYNGSGLDRPQWDALQLGPPVLYGPYRRALQRNQNFPTKHEFFLLATRQDAFINHLDLSAMVRANLTDHSTLNWLEAKYNWPSTSLAFQFQFNHGDARSEYGAASESKIFQVLLTQFF
jgi:hypothetical protein